MTVRMVLHIGIHAQIMPTFSSMMVQRDEAISSGWGLVGGAKHTQGEQLTSLIGARGRQIQRLHSQNACHHDTVRFSYTLCKRWVEFTTHKAPIPKTTINAAFWFLGNRDFQSRGIGRTSIMTSVAIEKPALAYQLSVTLIQEPGINLFQARGTGVHWNMEAQKVATINAHIIVSIT